MDDLISRQAAIDAVSRGCQAFGIFAECEKNLNALPSAERHGRWIHKDPSGTSCSKCGSLFPMFMGLYDYCPNCGAKMDEVSE